MHLVTLVAGLEGIRQEGGITSEKINMQGASPNPFEPEIESMSKRFSWKLLGNEVLPDSSAGSSEMFYLSSPLGGSVWKFEPDPSGKGDTPRRVESTIACL